MSTHEQVWVRVNAPVDKGIAPLVAALNGFQKLQTIESCERVRDGSAWVTFIYGEPGEQSWEPLAKFVLGFIGPEIAKELGDRVRLSIEVTEAGLYRAEMAVNPEAISATVKLLTKLQTKAN